jgi:hypothetical protein
MIYFKTFALFQGVFREGGRNDTALFQEGPEEKPE